MDLVNDYIPFCHRMCHCYLHLYGCICCNLSLYISNMPCWKFLLLQSQVKLGTSESIGSVEFQRFPCDRIPIQISSDEFLSVPMGSVDFQQIPDRKFSESTGTFPATTGPESCRKEIVGTQRSRPKKTGSIGSVAGKQRK